MAIAAAAQIRNRVREREAGTGLDAALSCLRLDQASSSDRSTHTVDSFS